MKQGDTNRVDKNNYIKLFRNLIKNPSSVANTFVKEALRKSIKKKKNMKTITLDIPNMKSAHCQMAVKHIVEKLAGAQSISTKSGQAEIAYDEKEISKPTIVEAIEKVGYQVLTTNSLKSTFLKLWKH